VKESALWTNRQRQGWAMLHVTLQATLWRSHHQKPNQQQKCQVKDRDWGFKVALNCCLPTLCVWSWSWRPSSYVQQRYNLTWICYYLQKPPSAFACTTAACYHAVHQQAADEASSIQRMLLNILVYCNRFSVFWGILYHYVDFMLDWMHLHGDPWKLLAFKIN